MTGKFLIYTLSDPRTNQIRYVGKSQQGLKRPRMHAREARKTEPDGSYKYDWHVYRWIRQLQAEGFQYEIDTIELAATPEELCEAEEFYIGYFKSIGADLTNHTNGGKGCPGRRMSPEQRENLRKVNLGNRHSLGYRFSPEQRQVISKRMLGNTIGLRHREQIAKKLLGHKRTAESVARTAAGSSKPIIDQNGTVYPSLNEAARCLGLHSTSICKQLKGIYPTAGGFTFKYQEQ